MALRRNLILRGREAGVSKDAVSLSSLRPRAYQRLLRSTAVQKRVMYGWSGEKNGRGGDGERDEKPADDAA